MLEQFCDRIWIQHKNYEKWQVWYRSQKKEVKFCHIVLLQCHTYLSIKSVLLYTIKRISKNHYFFKLHISESALRAFVIQSNSDNNRWYFYSCPRNRINRSTMTFRESKAIVLSDRLFFPAARQRQIAAAERNVYSPIPLKLRHRINLAVKRRSWRPP